MTKAEKGKVLPYHFTRGATGRPVGRGLVIVELMLVITILALLLSIVAVSPIERIRRARVDEDVFSFAHTLRTTIEHSVMQRRYFAVVVDVYSGYYTVYETAADEEIDYDQEPVIARAGLDICYILQIDHQDGTHQYSGELILRATPQGWKRSVVFHLIDDRDERMRYLRCNRDTTSVATSRQLMELPEPRKNVSL